MFNGAVIAKAVGDDAKRFDRLQRQRIQGLRAANHWVEQNQRNAQYLERPQQQHRLVQKAMLGQARLTAAHKDSEFKSVRQIAAVSTSRATQSCCLQPAQLNAAQMAIFCKLPRHSLRQQSEQLARRASPMMNC